MMVMLIIGVVLVVSFIKIRAFSLAYSLVGCLWFICAMVT